LHFSSCKNLIVKEKKKKKKANPLGGEAWLQRSNAINDGAVRLGCVYGVVFWFLLSKGLRQPPNLLHFFLFFSRKALAAMEQIMTG
jgi:hypothetical protein